METYIDLEILEEKYVEEMCKWEGVDRELGHVKADALLCEFLTDLGYTELVDAYNKISKWYV